MLDKFKEECGVFGIFGHRNGEHDVPRPYALQHRGRERRHCLLRRPAPACLRAMAYVNETFDENVLASLVGRMAVGP